MDVLHARTAGMDISKSDAKVCVRIAGAGRRGGSSSATTTWGSMTGQILALRDHLVEQQVTCVVMEATGDYWKPFYYLLEDGPFEVILANAGQVKNMPGRKRRCLGCGVAGSVGGAWVGAALVRAARADPSAT